MNISGLQKMTLLDFPGKVACTVFLSGCNFLCPFCHNSELIGKDAETLMTEDELLSFLKKRTGILEGICITGGEPTLQEGLVPFIKKVKDLGYQVKLDTNGYKPDILKKLIDEKLVDYVAMDIKNSEEKYAETAGLESFDFSKIKQSMSILTQDVVPYEFRTTIVNELHTLEDIKSVASLLSKLLCGKKAPRYALQAFCDRDTVRFSGFSAPAKTTLEGFKQALLPVCSEVLLRGV